VTLLLDTHAFLWWIEDNPRLSAPARTAIADPDAEVYLSAASGWEIAIKAGLGRLTLPDNLSAFMSEQLEKNDFRVLPIRLAHALNLRDLPDLHRDPFDRMLVAQCRTEGLALVTADTAFRGYELETVW
jgi:PIN domain nuclease of toxin-antitoxin system